MLAIIAGQGDLPRKIIDARLARGLSVVVVAFEGQISPEFIQNLPDTVPFICVKLGQIEPILSFLKQWNVHEITMVGGIKRPNIRDLSVDWMGARWIKALGLNIVKGDDALLSGIVSLLEREGCRVVPASHHLDDLFMPVGIKTTCVPSKGDLSDIRYGVSILTALSPLDVGQAVVVRQGLVLGIETIEGTAQLLERIKHYHQNDKDASVPGHVTSGVLVKMRKIGQNQNVDLPTIGVNTIRQVVGAGLIGIAIEREGVQVIDAKHVIQVANDENIFINCF